MHIQVLRENLLKVFQTASKFSAQKTQLPILSHLAIFAESEGIYVVGSDVDRSASLRLAGKVIKKGSFSVPARILTELTQNLPMGAVDLESRDGASLQVKAGNVKAVLQGLGTDEFPRPKFVREQFDVIGEYKVKDWEWVIDRLNFSVSRDDSRPVLTGVLWEMGTEVLAATDGYRLSVVGGKISTKSVDKNSEEVIIPGGIFYEGIKVFSGDAAEKITMAYNPEKKEMALVNDDLLVIGRVIEGEYPQYEAIIPKNNTLKVSIDREQLLQAVKTAAIFARESAHIITFTFSEGKLLVSANAPQVGDNVISVEYLSELGGGKGDESKEIAFNSRYLIECLSSMKTKEVSFGMSESLQPGIFAEGKKELYKHVIMPVRVKREE